jgi:hypothetical protein
MNVYLDLENPGGSGFWVGGYMSQGREIGEQFTSNLGMRWTDPVTTRRVPNKLKGTEQGSKGSKGRKRKKMFMYISILVSCT